MRTHRWQDTLDAQNWTNMISYEEAWLCSFCVAYFLWVLSIWVENPRIARVCIYIYIYKLIFSILTVYTISIEWMTTMQNLNLKFNLNNDIYTVSVYKIYYIYIFFFLPSLLCLSNIINHDLTKLLCLYLQNLSNMSPWQ